VVTVTAAVYSYSQVIRKILVLSAWQHLGRPADYRVRWDSGTLMSLFSGGTAKMFRRRLGAAMSLLLVGSLLVGVKQDTARADVPLPSGFQDQIVFAGLDYPTNMEFAANGMIFVTEKGGKIKVFDNLGDSDPTVFADLSTNVLNIGDRGLLGLALHPNFPVEPWIYVLYTLDALPGGNAPHWNDDCDQGSGSCLAMGRLSKLKADASGKVMTGVEQVLAEGWCQQFVSHSIGDLKFGADGMLYATGGDGANFWVVDYGQLGSPANPCGEPSMEGGAVRSQSVRGTSSPVRLNGTVLRLDPVTGAPAPGNPYLSSPDLNKQKIVGYGLRNPFRMTMRPGTSEVWIGDTGWNSWEDIERLVNPLAMTVQNFGWPCYEGAGQAAGYKDANVPLCQSLYPAGSPDATTPYATYDHVPEGQPGEGCAYNGSSPTGLAFYPHTGGTYPAEYAGALFVADYSRACIYVMKTAQQGGLPAPGMLTFATAATPVDLELGPDNDLYYVSLNNTIHVIRYYTANRPPVALIQASPVSGNNPLTVTFDASPSYDVDPADQLTYQWDWTNDGTFDATGKVIAHTYNGQATYTAKLKVTDLAGASDTETVQVHVNGFPPAPVISTPLASKAWKVGESISFSGSATDPDDGTLPASKLEWQLTMQHCVTGGGCHAHPLQTWTGVASGSFIAPDHELPAHLELSLTATDSTGQKSTVVRALNPNVVDVAIETSPAGLKLTTEAYTATTPYTVQLIQNAKRTVIAPNTQTLNGKLYAFAGWSDGGAQTHVITIAATQQPLVATYITCAGWMYYVMPGLCNILKEGPPPPPPGGRPHYGMPESL
jgi:glucose/arabinose dehydrogenase